ncbi:MAG: phosphoribosylamine--glycine ligase [Oceanospirillaceae bacterium]
MNILIIGSGGREHALAWSAAKDKKVTTVFVAPGNGGTATEPKMKNVALDIMDSAALIKFAQENDIALTIVGPEAPLVAGVVDDFRAAGLAIFGPTAAAAQLEGSKVFSKDFLERHNIPTATYQNFTEIAPALEYLQKVGAPIVIKADGLAAGKGVIVAMDLTQAQDAVRDMLAGNKFGEAGSRVVIEEFLTGEEASFIVMVDGDNVLPMATSQDHKRVGDGDTGPNTGGMGAYSPAPVVSDEIHQRIMEQVILPTVQGMKDEGNQYTGFLYAGVMIDSTGQPKVIEFNCRFGDPETQPIMLRLQTSIVDMCQAALSKSFDSIDVKWDPRPAVGVVMAAGGYPDSYAKGTPITIEDNQQSDTKVFHAGTQLQDGKLVTSGGRVLCIASLGESVTQAQQKAYTAVANIHWDKAFYRSDIAYRAIDREKCS